MHGASESVSSAVAQVSACLDFDSQLAAFTLELEAMPSPNPLLFVEAGEVLSAETSMPNPWIARYAALDLRRSAAGERRVADWSSK